MNYNDLFEKVLTESSKFAERIQVGKNENGAKAFKCTPKTKKMKLWEIFGNGAKMPKEFNNAYIAATSGGGYESRRITQLNSSSLLALLCFWNVSENKPLEIDGFKYTQVFFEVENEVFNHNSSIDILLISKDNSEYLFLESKFTEILNPTNQYWLGEKYHNIYTAISDNLGKIKVSDVMTREHKVNGKTKPIEEFSITQNKKRYYAGIKQMISHIIGLLRGPGEDMNAPHKEAYNKTNIKIKLGTILYDFSKFDVEDFSKKYEDYVEFYKKSFTSENNADIISKIVANPILKDKVKLNANTLEIIKEPLTYQDIFVIQNPHFLLQNVSNFYKLCQESHMEGPKLEARG